MRMDAEQSNDYDVALQLTYSLIKPRQTTKPFSVDSGFSFSKPPHLPEEKDLRRILSDELKNLKEIFQEFLGGGEEETYQITLTYTDEFMDSELEGSTGHISCEIPFTFNCERMDWMIVSATNSIVKKLGLDKSIKQKKDEDDRR